MEQLVCGNIALTPLVSAFGSGIVTLLLTLCAAFSDSAELFPPLEEEPAILSLITRFDAAVSRQLSAIDPATGLLRKTDAHINAEKRWDWNLLKGPQEARSAIAERYDPLYMHGYWLGRGSAGAIGTVGLAYACPLSKYCGDNRLLEAFNRGVQAYAEHQTDDGEFIFAPIKFASVYGTHEQAWRLEPFLMAYNELKDRLAATDRERCRDMLSKGMEFLSSNPNHEPCNRGVVWAAVMALGGRVLGRADYVDQARQGWRRVSYIFLSSGEVDELFGMGPDLVYARVSLYYGFLYRMMTGDESADPLLVRALEWILKVHDANMIPYNEIGTRKYSGQGGMYGLLPLYLYYAGQRPDFMLVAEKLMPMGRSSGITEWVAARVYKPVAQPASMPAHLLDYFELYSRRQGTLPERRERRRLDSEYIVVRHAYQTLVSLAGVHPWKGIQHWTLGDNQPLLQPVEDRVASTAITSDTNLAAEHVQTYRVDRSLLDSLTTLTGDIYRTYVFTPTSTIVIQTSAKPVTTRWITPEEPIVSEAGELRFDRAGASIFFSAADFEVRQLTGRNAIEFKAPAGMCWFAFAAPGTFSPIEGVEHEGEVFLAFRDSSGEYLVLANHSAATATVGLAGLKTSRIDPTAWALRPLASRVIDAAWLRSGD